MDKKIKEHNTKNSGFSEPQLDDEWETAKIRKGKKYIDIIEWIETEAMEKISKKLVDRPKAKYSWKGK